MQKGKLFFFAIFQLLTAVFWDVKFCRLAVLKRRWAGWCCPPSV